MKPRLSYLSIIIFILYLMRFCHHLINEYDGWMQQLLQLRKLSSTAISSWVEFSAVRWICSDDFQ